MRVHPVIFRPWAVQTIIDGRKTMTRRIVRWPHYSWENEFGATSMTYSGR